MASAEDCAFCGIAAGSSPAHVLYEDDVTVAFLDIAPLTRGHALVIPKAHARTLLDMDEDLAGAVMVSARRVAEIPQRSLDPEGFTLLQANEAVGWQTVFHMHVHVIPRWRTDGIGPPALPPRRGDDLATLARSIVDGA